MEVRFCNQRQFKSAWAEEIWFSVHKKCSCELLHSRRPLSGSLPAPLVSWCIIISTEVACLASIFLSEPLWSPPRAFATVVTHVFSRYPMSNSPVRNSSTLSLSVSPCWLISKFHKKPKGLLLPQFLCPSFLLLLENLDYRLPRPCDTISDPVLFH